MFVATRRWFPIFERSQVLLLRIKLLFNKRLGKPNNNLLPNFSPTLPKHCQLLYIFIVNWIPMREQRKFAKKSTPSTTFYLLMDCATLLRDNSKVTKLWQDFAIVNILETTTPKLCLVMKKNSGNCKSNPQGNLSLATWSLQSTTNKTWCS